MSEEADRFNHQTGWLHQQRVQSNKQQEIPIFTLHLILMIKTNAEHLAMLPVGIRKLTHPLPPWVLLPDKCIRILPSTALAPRLSFGRTSLFLLGTLSRAGLISTITEDSVPRTVPCK